MGGHGGLNILPQKSWNVYGRKNRLKVAQDEEAEGVKLEAERRKSEHIARESRLATLQGDETAEARQAKQHINFWEDWESNAVNAAIDEEKKAARRNRGDPTTQTSDARFDESFRVMHGISGPAPWYARPKQRADDSSVAQNKHSTVSALETDQGVRGGGAPGASLPCGGPSVAESSELEVEGLKGGSHKRKEKKKSHKHHTGSTVGKSHKQRKRQAGDDVTVGRKSIEELRAERLKREAAETARTQALLHNSFR